MYSECLPFSTSQAEIRISIWQGPIDYCFLHDPWKCKYSFNIRQVICFKKTKSYLADITQIIFAM